LTRSLPGNKVGDMPTDMPGIATAPASRVPALASIAAQAFSADPMIT
jgi:hypothetical protein